MEPKKTLVYVAIDGKGLETEVAEINRLLLELDYIPVFSTLALGSDVNGYDWNRHKELIEQADLMLCVVGRHYGSLLDTGESPLHKELAYAFVRKKPLIGFLKNVTREEIPTGEEQKLKMVHTMLMKGYFKYWHLTHELTTHIENGLAHLEKQHQFVGWVPANKQLLDDVESKKAVAEPEKLDVEEVEFLWPIYFNARVFAHGNVHRTSGELVLDWEKLFLAVGADLITPITEEKLCSSIELHVQEQYREFFLAKVQDAHAVTDIEMEREHFVRLKAYMHGLGYMNVTASQQGFSDRWSLSQLGKNRLNQLINQSVLDSRRKKVVN